MAIKTDALSQLVQRGFLPNEPEIGADGEPYLLLLVERTYGSAPTGRKYAMAMLGRKDELGNQIWTATGRSPNTPENATWPQVLVWLCNPSKSKWNIWVTNLSYPLADSKKLNHELYRSGK